MSSQVLRVEGFSKGSLMGIGREVEREENYVLQHRNPDIDIERTHLNHIYKQTKNGMYGEFKDICKKLNVSNADNLKKNATAFEGIVITSDKEYFENLGYVPGQEPPEKVKEFFDKSYDFAKQEIGFQGTDNNILSAVVHYDETTPHLQLYYVPVVDSWKDKVYQKDENGKVLKNANGSPIQARDNKGKIIYKDIENSEERRLNRTQFWQNKGGKNSYSLMQDRYYEQISKEYGLGRGEKGSTKQHTTKAQWEAQKLEKELDIKTKELTAHQQKIEKLKSELEYAKDGSVSIPQLANKQKITEIQDQNKALKVEVLNLQTVNSELMSEVKKFKNNEKERNEALKNRNSIERRSLDALESENIYKAFLFGNPQLEPIMRPFDNFVKRTHEYCQQMVKHKQRYVECIESRKIALKSIQDAQVIKSIIEKNLSEIRAIERHINDFKNRLTELEKGREQCTTLQFLKKRDFDKQISDCKEKIKEYEKTLEGHSISEKILNHEKELQKYIQQINDKSIHANNLTSQAQEHLKEYKLMIQAKECLNPSPKRIIERYDKEYEPPKEYSSLLSHQNKEGLPKGKANEREEIKKTIEYWKDIMNNQKVNKMLEKPQISTPKKSIDRGMSR